MKPNFSLKSIHYKYIIAGIVALALAIGAFQATRWLVSTWQLTALGTGIAVVGQPTNDPSLPDLPTPAPAIPLAELPPPWDGASRVTVLLIGLDARDWLAGEGAPRSDTLLVLTLDPLSRSAGVFSVPRDLWVNIPGFGHGRINTAYSLGEGNRLPGGGPVMSMRTVESLIGVPINYYAQIDFGAFERFIDEIGGIHVYIPETIKLSAIGEESRIFEAKAHKLDGKWALAYARARNTEGGDVDRAHRQQQVILAIKDRLSDPVILARLVTRAPALYSELAAGIRTNLSLDDAIELGLFALQIPTNDIKRGVIDYTMANIGTGPQEAKIMIPVPDQIRVLRDEIFTEGGALSPVATGELIDILKEENATISVLNGTYTPGLAGRTAEYLQAQGLNVVNIGNPAQQGYARTVIIDYRGKPYVVRYLLELFRVAGGNQFQVRFDANAIADVEIIIGDDWVFNNPMP
jgi:polyisoprenyl-teichoic acid--peptidoglycan teichoic acid transferase